MSQIPPTDTSISHSEEIPFEAQDLLNALNENTWQQYVEVMAKPNARGQTPEVAIETIRRNLDPEDGRAVVVEITGVGGLGKTTAAREYMKRVINRKPGYHKLPYDYYFYYTSKGEQGEIETTFGAENFIRPAGWKEGGGTYIQKLGFNVFLKKICTSLDIEHTKKALEDYLLENRVLIVLDNFEDVRENEDSYLEYVSFFQNIWVGKNKSRIIVTSRQQGQFSSSATEIKLDELDGVKASELIYKRYVYLNRDVKSRFGIDAFNYSERVQNFIAKYVNDKEDLVGDVLKKLDKTNHQKEEINLNLSHPVMLLRLSSILSSKIVKEATQQVSEEVDDREFFLSLIANIIIDEEYGFLEYNKQVVAYIIKKAWDSILRDPFCVEILKLLLEQGEDGLEHNAIKRKLQDHPEFREERSLIQKMDNAIDEIRDHSVFLEDDDVEGETIKLRNDARKNLQIILKENIQNEDESSEHTPLVSKNLADFFQLKRNYKTFTWEEFSDLTRYFAVVRSHPGYANEIGSEELLEIESEIYGRLEKTTGKQIRAHLKSFLDFMAASKQRTKGMAISLQHLNVLIECLDEISAEHLEMLCANWFAIGQHRFNEIEELTRIQALAMLLKRGVQQNAEKIRTNFFSLLSEIDPDDMELAFSSSEERKILNDHLDRYRGVIPWNLNVQEIFKRMKTQNSKDFTNSNKEHIRAPACFVVDVYGEIAKHGYEISIHPSSATKDFDANTTCYITNISQENKSMTLYLVQQEPLEKTESLNINEIKFNDWLSQPSSSHPGLSPDPRILAADLLAVREFYNQVFTNQGSVDVRRLHPFSRAEKLKKQFHKYHTTEDTANSAAFIIGYRIEHNHLDNDAMKQILTAEFDRRIELWPVPNIFFTDQGQRNAWKKHFQHLVERALRDLTENEDEVRQVMNSRERSMHKESKRGSIQNKPRVKIEVGDSDMPENLQRLLYKFAGSIMVSRTHFKQQLIQATGGLSKNKGEQKVIQKGWISAKEMLRVEAFWLEPICRVVFSRPLNGFTRYEPDEVENLIREIVETHIQSLNE